VGQGSGQEDDGKEMIDRVLCSCRLATSYTYVRVV
jgi:hypothetical protein